MKFLFHQVPHSRNTGIKINSYTPLVCLSDPQFPRNYRVLFESRLPAFPCSTRVNERYHHLKTHDKNKVLIKANILTVGRVELLTAAPAAAVAWLWCYLLLLLLLFNAQPPGSSFKMAKKRDTTCGLLIMVLLFLGAFSGCGNSLKNYSAFSPYRPTVRVETTHYYN